jgi:hypothetical protein
LLAIPLLFDGFSNKEVLPPQCLQLLFFCIRIQSWLILATMFPSRVKLLALVKKLFSPTLISVFTEVPRIFLFEAVRLSFTQVLSPLWSDRGCPFSETPVSLLTHTHLVPLSFYFDADFFVLVILK